MYMHTPKVVCQVIQTCCPSAFPVDPEQHQWTRPLRAYPDIPPPPPPLPPPPR